MCRVQTRLAAFAALAASLISCRVGGAAALLMRFLMTVAALAALFLASRLALCLPSTSAW